MTQKFLDSSGCFWFFPRQMIYAPWYSKTKIEWKLILDFGSLRGGFDKGT